MENFDVAKKLDNIKRKFRENRVGIERAAQDEFGIDLFASYLDTGLRNPIILAPGQLTQYRHQIEKAAKAGFGAAVLKSVVGEDKHGNASMKIFRRKPTFMRWYYDKDDTEHKYPIIHWNGGLDPRSLTDYLKFAKEAYESGKKTETPTIASFLSHLPSTLDEEWKVEEWIYTAEKLFDMSYNHMEIDFCPFIKGENLAENKEIVLRWYREAPSFVKDVSSDIKVVPKILNLDFGFDFQIEMVKAAKKGGADGVTIANRFFRKVRDEKTGEEYRTAHGGRELKEVNQREVAKAVNLGIPISATGGIYTGRDVWEYLSLGAKNTQLLTYVMKNGFEKSFESLLLDPKEGLIITMISKGTYSFR